jgi:hypothetical protein
MGLSVGEVLSGTLGILRERLWPLVGMWFAYLGLSIVLMLGFGMVIGVSAMSGFAQNYTAGLTGLGTGFVVSIILFYLVYFLLYFAQFGSLVAKSTPLQDPGFGEALFAGLRSAPTLLLATLLLGIVYVVAAVILSLLGTALVSMGSLGVLVMVLICVPLVIFLGMRLSLVLPVAVVERQLNPITVIARSWSLTQGKVLSIFLAWLVFAVAFVALCMLVFVPVWGSLNDAASPPSGGMAAYLVIGMMAVFVLFSLAQSAMLAVIHGAVSGSTGVDIADTFG